MTQPRPTAEELLEAVRGFLADELLPTLDGRSRFHTRVAVNVLDTVVRELRDGPAADDAARARLRELLGVDGDADALTRSLAARLREGTVPVDDPQVLDHLRRTARDDLGIANPRHLPEPGS